MPDISVTGPDGTFSAYLALPAGGRGPGLVLIQEIFGVNHVMRDLADGFAAEGYVVACADLFWRQQPGIQITDKTEDEWARAFELYKGFDETKGVEDLSTTLAWLRRHEAVTGKVGTCGYCLGGKLSYFMATRSDADANVSYYGVGIDQALNEAPNITRPLLMHIAEKDQFVPPEAQAAMTRALAGNTLVEVHIYPGMDHAFARVDGEHYDATAVTLANGRTVGFMSEHLNS